MKDKRIISNVPKQKHIKGGNKMDMSNKTEAIIAMLAAFFVLLSAMFNPKISAGLAIVFFIVLATYKLYQSKTK